MTPGIRFEFSLSAFNRLAGPDCPVGLWVGKDKLIAWCSIHRRSHQVSVEGRVEA